MRPLALGLRAPYRLKRTIALLAQATLNLDFTRGGPLDSRVTFTRASGGTSFRPVGRGTLVNQLLWSGDFSNVVWNSFGASFTRSAVSTAGPYYDIAWKITATATPGVPIAVVTASATSVTLTAIYKVGTFSPNGWLVRNTTTSTNLAATATSVSMPNGWTLISIAVNAGITVGDSISLYFGATGSVAEGLYWFLYRCGLLNGTYTAQQILDNGGIPLTFTAADNLLRLDAPGDPLQLFTVPANVPRFDYDPVSRQCRGLLVEEQRTNLVTHSHEFDNAAWSKNAATVVPNAAVAPDGTLTADKIIATSANTQHYVFGGGASIAANSTGTLSIYAKAAEQSSIAFSASGSGAFTAIFDLAAGSVSYQAGGTAGMSPVGNGWYRCWFTCTTTAFAFVPYLFPNTSNSYAGDGVSGVLVWGGQHEAGAFHTSHIPTSGAAATRALEQPVVNTLSPWYNATEGTLLVGVASSKATATQYAAAAALVGSAATVNYVVPSFNTLNTITHITGGSTMVQPAVVSGQAAKVALGLSQASQSMIVNGGTPVTRAVSAPLDQMTALRIGYWEGNPGQLNGHIRRIAYWPRRMSNLDLQGLTR